MFKLSLYARSIEPNCRVRNTRFGNDMLTGMYFDFNDAVCLLNLQIASLNLYCLPLAAYFRVCIARGEIERQKTMIIRPRGASRYSENTLGSCLYICQGIYAHDLHGMCYPQGRTELSKE
ncbi:hypothetical protein O6H91_15G071200 [Diphasiastrum complanatum]|nr:hypothetical protein O6H91_15G071200 [Diphasiastrum complanatum]